MLINGRLVHYWKIWKIGPNTRWCTQRTVNVDKDGQFNTQILDYLVCPLTKQTLEYDAERQLLISRDIGVAYPIVRGIPNMNPKDAKKLKELDGTTSRNK